MIEADLVKIRTALEKETLEEVVGAMELALDEIYAKPIRKSIQQKRLEAFYETCFGSREHKLESQAMVNAYDVVLELIDKGE